MFILKWEYGYSLNFRRYGGMNSSLDVLLRLGDSRIFECDYAILYHQTRAISKVPTHFLTQYHYCKRLWRAKQQIFLPVDFQLVLQISNEQYALNPMMRTRFTLLDLPPIQRNERGPQSNKPYQYLISQTTSMFSSSSRPQATHRPPLFPINRFLPFPTTP